LLKLFKKVKDPGSALTHFIGVVLSIIASVILIPRAYRYYSLTHVVAITIFALSLILLYTASTLYHTFNLTDKVNRNLRKFDHMMIYCLIAGTYTPVCLILLEGLIGYIMLAVIWTMAIIGMFIALFIANPHKGISAIVYIIMGWTCIFALKPLYEGISLSNFLWLLVGGLLYTIGGVIYALKLPIFNRLHPNFGNHEIFHVFVLLASTCHVIFVLEAIIPIPV